MILYSNSVDNVLRRSFDCETYFESLATLIYETPKNATDVSSYTTNNFNHTNSPIAISFVIHDQPGLFEILFHVMFRPYNSYCIIIDPKSSEDIKIAFQSVLKCYQERFSETNIFIAKWITPITYQSGSDTWATGGTGYSSLNADLTCLELLYNKSE